MRCIYDLCAGMKISHIIILIVVAVSMVVIYTSIDDSSSYESFEIARDNPDKEFHIVGELVMHEKMVYNPIENPNLFSFYLEDEDGEVSKVLFYDVKPQDFERSEQVVLIGSMKDDHFHAREILTKCPSKYVDDDIEVVDADV